MVGANGFVVSQEHINLKQVTNKQYTRAEVQDLCLCVWWEEALQQLADHLELKHIFHIQHSHLS